MNPTAEEKQAYTDFLKKQWETKSSNLVPWLSGYEPHWPVDDFKPGSMLWSVPSEEYPEPRLFVIIDVFIEGGARTEEDQERFYLTQIGKAWSYQDLTRDQVIEKFRRAWSIMGDGF